VQVLDRSPRPVLRAVGAETYGHALLAVDRRSEALAQLDRAWDEYHRMGAKAFRDNVQGAMRQAGARRTKWSTAAAAPAAGWASLTEAERRVATLISQGHTNKSAASGLGVSINTVGTHLRAVFAKLGVQSRVQLANYLASYASEVPVDSVRRPTLSPTTLRAHHLSPACGSGGDWSDRPVTSLVRCTRELTPSFSKTWRR
jgi:DNA-binding CsgD family transcriptional regulator